MIWIMNDEKKSVPEDLLSTRQFMRKKRISSLDFVKGLAINLIIVGHITALWFDAEWVFVSGFMLIYLDFFGPGLFLLLSALSVVFSVKNKEGKVKERIIRQGILMRALILIIIGLLFNMVALSSMGVDVSFPLILWGWNILTFIGFSQIFCYYFLKLSISARVVIGLIITFTSEFIRAQIYIGMDENILLLILNFIITSPAPTVTLFPWIVLSIFGTIFGELLYVAMMDGSEEVKRKLFRQYMFWGAILVAFAISIGWPLSTPESLAEVGGLEEYPHLALYNILNTNPYYHYDGMQNFLIRGTASNMVFLIGIDLMVIGICFYFIDIKGADNNFTRMLIFYGKVSLTLFLVHHIFFNLFVLQLNIIFFWFVMLGFLGSLGFLMWIWQTWGWGIGTAEWLIAQVGWGRPKKRPPKPVDS